MPEKFHALHLFVTQTLDGGRLTRQMGRVSLRRRELLNDEPFDGWLPISRVPGSLTTEILGDMCLDVSYDPATKMLLVRVLDYTVWQNNSSASVNHQLLQETLSATSKNGGSGRLFLKVCVSADKSLFSSMKKSRVMERRTLESIRLDCTQLFSSKHDEAFSKANDSSEQVQTQNCHNNTVRVSKTVKQQSPKQVPAPKSRTKSIPAQRISFQTPTVAQDESQGTFECVGASLSSTSSTATTPSWKLAGSNMTPTPTPIEFGANGTKPATNFFFPPTGQTFSGANKDSAQPQAESIQQQQQQLRLNIKVYGEASYDESSYCGYVRVPLDNSSMLPKNLPLGPNWFNIKSRTLNSQLNTAPTDTTKTTPTTAKEQPVSHHFRHSSTPSTSTASTSPAHNLKTTTGSLKSSVLATRSSPLRPTPSLASLRGLLTGNSNATQMTNSLSLHYTSPAPGTAPPSTVNTSSAIDPIGEMRLRLWYNVEEVLPLVHYQPLYTNLIKSLIVKPYSSSTTSLLQYLPIDMENIAKPLMKIFVHANQIRQFFRLVCSEYVSRCHDVNTLFRSQTMASKIMYELMKFVGHDYLVISLKPLIDLIYAERKCCEIDPSKLKPGDLLEHNLRNITVYAELAFSRVVDSYQRCPQVLREVFAELREVVNLYFPGRDDVARLALSSFLIMRFFAAAILNPKLFALKRDTPDAEISRTLVLVSKILQRLANCVVSAVPLTTKEQWLTPVLLRFSNDAHKTAMINFLDGISISATHDVTNDENVSPNAYKDLPVLLKHGQMVERRSGGDKKRSFKNLIHQKRRYVTLTETQLNWQKIKESTSAGGQGQPGEFISETDQHKGFALSEITSVSPLPEVKNSFRVATPSSEVHFQAHNAVEMNEWLIVIQKQQRRHIMQQNRPSSETGHFLTPSTARASVDVDMEREMQLIHSHFYEHLETLYQWKNALETDQDLLLRGLHTSSSSPNANILGLPLEKIFAENNTVEEQKSCLAKLRETLISTIAVIEQIQAAHQSAKNLSQQMKMLQARPTLHEQASHLGFQPCKNVSLEHNVPIGHGVGEGKMVDSENYLHLRQRNKRIKKSIPAQFKLPTPLQPPSLIVENSSLGMGEQQLIALPVVVPALQTTNI